MKSEVLQSKISLIALVLFTGLFAFQGHAKDKYYYVHEDFKVESVDMVQDTCPYEIDDAGEICCDTTGCGPAFNPGVIRETVAPSGGTGNYVYMWLISRVVFNPDGSQSWTPPEPVRNPNGTLYAGRDYAPGPLDVPTRLRRCVSTQECIDGGYGFFKETDIVTIWVDDCNCEPDSGGEIGEDQSTCFPMFDPNQLNSITPALPADPGDQIVYRWYFSFANTSYPNPSWMRIIGANSEDYDPPVTNRDIYYIREAINPYCPDSPVVSNIVEIIIGGDFSLTENTTNVDCPGNDNGTADVFISNGNGPFEIVWSNSSTDFRITGLAPGIYEYTVTDAADCPKTGSITISEPNPINIDGLVSNTTCEAGNDGQINITVEGGTGSYSYSWDQGLPAQEDQAGLSAGLYCVTVTDANDCKASACFEINEPRGIDISADIDDADCFGGNEGSISLSITGGTAPFDYNWDNGLPNSPNPNELTAGTYCVTVTDVNGCQSRACIDVDQPTEIKINGQVTNADCKGASTGSVQVSVSGGTGGYDYTWTDNLSNGPAISNIPAGEFCVTVTDANECELEACFTVEEPEALKISGISEDVSCPSGSDGSISVSVSGGTGTYSYNWSGTNQTGAEITGLSAGEYCVTVTDENGCISEECFTIGEPDELEITGVVSNILCNGEETGSIDITVTGGTPTYSYSWDIPSSVEDPEDLTAGNYCVTVTDANGCTTDACFDIKETDDLSIDADIQDIDCFGNENGSISLTVSGGTPAYTYNWDNSLPEGPTQNDLVFGTYCVTVTDVNECEASDCFTINQPPSIGITAQAVDVNCFGESTGSISLTVLGGTGNYSYEWGNTALPNLPEVTDLLAGVYCVTVTDENGCEADKCFMINEPDELNITGQVNNPNCTGAFDGSIDLSVSGGTPAYSYNWDIPSTEEDPVGLGAGTYCVTVTDENGCTVEDCFTLIDPDDLVINGVVTNVQCPGTQDGSIDLSIIGGTPGYVVEWNDGVNTEDRNELGAGTYCVTVTDSKGCSAEDCFDVDEPEEISIAGDATDVSCFGDEDGSITITVTGGTPAYNYSWDNNLDNSAIQTDLAVGTYCVTVTDENGCLADACFQVEGPDEIDINGDVTDLDCKGSKDGAIDLTVLGGTPPYFYDWDNNLSSDEDQDNLPAGIYCVTVYDENNCQAEACFTINEPDELVIDGNAENADCAGEATGSITLNISGGTPAYVYAWDNGLPSIANQNNLESGTYCVTVTDTNGCSDKACFEVESPEELIISGMAMDVLCAGDDNGMIDLTIFGGTAPYDYNWSGTLDDTEDQFNLEGGTYCVTVTDANGCSDNACFEIEENDQLRLSASIVNVDCFGESTGSIDITVTGGTVDWYTFQWDSGLPPIEDHSDLSAGIYCVTVTDDNGCVVEDCFQIMQPHPIDIEGHVNNISCPGDDNGSISIHVSGGTPGYSYEWSNGATTESIGNLQPGTYCVTVTDDNDCEATECFEIDEPEELEITADVENIDCFNSKNGSINLTVSGGETPYQFRWDNLLPPTEDQDNLQPGTYCVTVTDKNGCIVEGCYEITEPMSIGLTAQVVDVKCGGDEDGFIDLVVIGGLGPFTFEWNTGDATEDLFDIGPGIYCVTATDANGCAEEACFEINEPDPLLVNSTVEGIDCHGAENGSIDLDVSGGTAPYIYNWNNGLVATQDQDNLSAGIYCVTVTDDNDCSFTDCFEIEDVEPIDVSGLITEPDCFGDKTGAIDLTVTGGIPPYDYNWSSGLSGTQDQIELGAGTYCVTITDQNGCHIERCYEITEPLSIGLTAQVVDVKCHGEQDGFIDVTIVGGVEPFSFEWNTGDVTEDLFNIGFGTYCVTATDVNGCTEEACFEISEPDPLLVNSSVEGIDCHDAENGSIDLDVSGGTTPYTYNWDNGLAGTQDQIGLGAGTYCVTVSDDNDCTFEECFEIEEVDPIILSAQITEPDCHGDQTGAIDLTVTGGTPAYSYNWNNGLPGTQDQSGLAAGTYCVTVTDDNGCTESDCFEINENDPLEVDADITNPRCAGDNDGSIDLTVTGGTVDWYTFQWDNGLPPTEDQTGLAEGTYCVTVIDDNGCIVEACYDIEAPNALVVNGTVDNVDCAENENGSIDLEVSGGTAPYTYNWDNGLTATQDQSDLAAGTYCVTVTDDNNCTFEACYEIKDVDPISLSTQITEPDCHGDQTGAIDLTVTGGTPAYSYNWNNGLPGTQDQSGLAAGTYCVTVTDDNGCTESDCFEINENDPLEVDADITNPRCAGDNDGSIDLTVTGGTVDWYTFQWDNGLPPTEDQTGLAEGTYCVTVIDDNGCIVEACYDIEAPNALVVNGTVDNIDCADDENGAINLDVSGGTAPYTYNWDNGLPSTQDQNNLTAGTYCVTITDHNDCSFQDCYIIEDVDPIDLNAHITEPDCHGDQTGAIDLTVTGGTAPYIYTWNNGLSSTQDQIGLGAGTYCVTITDAEGCEIKDCFDINENDPLEVNADLQDPTCPDAEDGSIDLTVTGGTVDWYTFQWDNGLPPTEDQTGLSAGTYCVTVVDDNGCVVEDCYTLKAPEEIIITGKETNVSCYNGSDGSINLQVSGGKLPYNYDWNNNLPDQANQTNLPAGIYCVTVTDENGCDGEACFTIEETDAIEITGIIQNALCLGDNSGSISTSVAGGTAPYNYSWSNSLPSTEDQNNLEAGTYCVTVTDSNDCEETKCFIIKEGEAITLSADLTSPACYNDATGAINLNVDGGEEPYLYNWSNNLPAQEDQNNIEAGTYCVTVTDNQGCKAEDCFTVNNPPKLDGKLIFTQPKCGEDNGTATVQVNGGTGNYSYEWSRNNNGTNSVSGLPVGLISVTVTDDNDCKLVLSKELEGSDHIDCNAFVVQMVSTRNGQDGIVDVDVSGGNGNYSYNWDLNGSSSTSKQVGGLSAGTYTVEVTDENDCSCISEVTLLNPAKVGDFVWSDLNGNGQQDIGEPGVRNIEVQLTGSDVNGNAINLTTTTDADGSYHFNVKPGTYSIHFAASGGYNFTNQDNASDDLDSDANSDGDTDAFVLSEGEYKPDIDAGLVQTAKVGDFVWFDTNQDGIQDAGESGVEGVTVRLIQAGPDGIFGNADDQIVATTISDINGMYMFNNLTPGEYQLIFDTNSLPANSMFTSADIGADDTDSDVLGVNGETDAFTLFSGDNRSDLDAGIKSSCSQLTNGGEIAGDEEGCSPSFNPGLIANVSAPGQGQYEYRWYESYINQPFDINSPEWRLIPGANGSSYDPGRIIYSTYFVRVARVKDCEGTAFVPANIVFKEVIGCDIECDNIVHAGLIGFSEMQCDPFDPDEIQNVQLPSGGSAGDIEYLWMMSTDDPPTSNTVWIPIQNSNTPNYDPGFVSETTHFMRCARREDCTNYVETNMVVKRVLGSPEAIIENSPAIYCIDEETTFTAEEFENIHKYEWTFEGADVTSVTGPSATVSWITPGDHTVELTTTDFFGCTNSSEITIEVSNDPQDCPNLSMQIILTASLNSNDQVELEYEAASEMPQVEFIIERTDKENGLFDQMNTLSEFMTTGIAETFTSMDYNPVYGYNYYRVRMVNEFGTEIASNIAQVLIQEEGQDVFLYPNPLVQDRLTVGSLDYFRAGTTIEILNVEGKVFVQVELDSRSYKEYFSTNGWAEGAYFVRISSPGERPTIIKFLKFNP